MVRLPDERSIVLLFNLGVFRFCKEIMPPATVAAILYVNILGVADVYNEKRRQIPAFSSSIWIRTRTNRTKICCATVTPWNYHTLV